MTSLFDEMYWIVKKQACWGRRGVGDLDVSEHVTLRRPSASNWYEMICQGTSKGAVAPRSRGYPNVKIRAGPSYRERNLVNADSASFATNMSEKFESNPSRK